MAAAGGDAQAGAEGAASGADIGGREPEQDSANASLGHLLTALLRDLPGLVSDRIHLVALELRRARHAAVEMLVMGFVAAFLAATAWIAFWAFVVSVALAAGLTWYGALFLVVLLNLAGGWFALRRARLLAGYLTLPATVRRLTVAPPVKPAPEASPPAGAGAAGSVGA